MRNRIRNGVASKRKRQEFKESPLFLVYIRRPKINGDTSNFTLTDPFDHTYWIPVGSKMGKYIKSHIGNKKEIVGHAYKHEDTLVKVRFPECKCDVCYGLISY